MLRILLLIVVTIAIALSVWLCRPANRAAQIAAQATGDQARLWQDVGRRGTPAGLARLPVQAPSVSLPRQPIQPPPQATPPAAQDSLAPAVVTGVRIVSTSRSGAWQHSGPARVATVDQAGERIELDLGANGRLVFVARLNRAPLGLMTGETVELFFSTNAQLFERERIFALRTGSGATIITAVKTGSAPVMLTVPLAPLTLIAAQTDDLPVNGTIPVSVDVSGVDKGMLMPFRTTQVGGLFIDLLGSVARTANPNAADGSPFVIDLIAWRPGAGRGAAAPPP